MYNSGKVILGILILVAAFTAPIWTNYIMVDENAKPNLVYPTNSTECVESKEYMKAYHMDLLDDWRDMVVREDLRFLEKDGQPVRINGKKIELSLTKSCLGCHTNKAEFCDQCHSYLKVDPYCWECHVVPEVDTRKEFTEVVK